MAEREENKASGRLLSEADFWQRLLLGGVSLGIVAGGGWRWIVEAVNADPGRGILLGWVVVFGPQVGLGIVRGIIGEWEKRPYYELFGVEKGTQDGVSKASRWPNE